MWVISKITWNDRWSHVPLFRSTNILKIYDLNKCIGDDTKDAARQSPNCIKKIKYGEKRFSIWRMDFLHPAMWHDHDIDFARWLHPAMWHVALESWLWIHQVAAPCSVIRRSGMTCHWIPRWQHPAMWHVTVGWHAIEFAQMSDILEFYIWFRFRPYHCCRHVILHQSAKFYPNRTTLGRKKWRHVDFLEGGSQPSWILWVQ